MGGLCDGLLRVELSKERDWIISVNGLGFKSLEFRINVVKYPWELDYRF